MKRINVPVLIALSRWISEKEALLATSRFDQDSELKDELKVVKQFLDIMIKDHVFFKLLKRELALLGIAIIIFITLIGVFIQFAKPFCNI